MYRFLKLHMTMLVATLLTICKVMETSIPAAYQTE